MAPITASGTPPLVGGEAGTANEDEQAGGAAVAYGDYHWYHHEGGLWERLWPQRQVNVSLAARMATKFQVPFSLWAVAVAGGYTQSTTVGVRAGTQALGPYTCLCLPLPASANPAAAHAHRWSRAAAAYGCSISIRQLTLPPHKGYSRSRARDLASTGAAQHVPSFLCFSPRLTFSLCLGSMLAHTWAVGPRASRVVTTFVSFKCRCRDRRWEGSMGGRGWVSRCVFV